MKSSDRTDASEVVRVSVDGVPGSGYSVQLNDSLLLETVLTAPTGEVDVQLELVTSASATQLVFQYGGPVLTNVVAEPLPVGRWPLGMCTVAAKYPVALPTLTAPDSVFETPNKNFSADNVRCTYTDEGTAPETIQHSMVVGQSNVTFYCQNKYGYGIERTVSKQWIMSTTLRMDLFGPTEMRIQQGDTYSSDDLFACCQDNFTKLDTYLAGNTTSDDGAFIVEYTCMEETTQVVAAKRRTVVVDGRPSIELLGDPTDTSGKAVGYIDSGAFCQDVGFGELTHRIVDQSYPSESLELLMFALEYIRPDVDLGILWHAVDGDASVDSSATCVDRNHLSHKTLQAVRADFHTTRIVHRVRAFLDGNGWALPLRIDVHSDPTWPPTFPAEDGDGSCFPAAGNVFNTSATAQWVDFVCQAPRAGRFVTLALKPSSWRNSATPPLTIYEFQVFGTAGPGFPSMFSAKCGNDMIEMRLYGADTKWPYFPRYFDVGTYKESAEQYVASYNANVSKWQLMSVVANNLVLAEFKSAEAMLGAPWTGKLTGGFGCNTWSILGDPKETDPKKVNQDTCPWLFEFAPTRSIECFSGKLIPDNSSSPCASDGGIAKCPRSTPQLCEGTSNDGKSINLCQTQCSNGLTPVRCAGMAVDPGNAAGQGSTKANCAYDGIYSDGLLASETLQSLTAGVSRVADCRFRCQSISQCAYFSVQSSSGYNSWKCQMFNESAVLKPSTDAKSGPRTCIPRVERSGSVKSDITGKHALYYSCVDQMGQRSLPVVRTVQVGCEDGEALGLSGGNLLRCNSVWKYPAGDVSWTACSDACDQNATCQAFERDDDKKQCFLHAECDGRYYQDNNKTRRVGYCRRTNSIPTVSLFAYKSEVYVNEAWTPPIVNCVDKEDPFPPTPLQRGRVDTSTPGLYSVIFECQDQAAQIANITISVLVIDTCRHKEAWAKDVTIATTPCQEGGNSFQRGYPCTPKCAEDYFPQASPLRCRKKEGGKDWESDWDLDFICAPEPCTVPDVLNSFYEENEPRGPKSCNNSNWSPDLKAYVVGLNGTCEPACKIGSELFLWAGAKPKCTKGGRWSPAQFDCNKKAMPPNSVNLPNYGSDFMQVSWKPAAPVCVFTRWHVEYAEVVLAQDNETWKPVGGSWIQVPTCNLTERSNTTCTIGNLVEGAFYMSRIMEKCNVSRLDSPFQESAVIKTKFVVPPELYFNAPSTDVTALPRQLLVAWSVACRYHNSTTDYMWIDRSGDHCTPARWNRTAYNVSMPGDKTVGSIQFIGGRVLLIEPPWDFFVKGCTFDIVLGARIVQTEERPSKFSPEVRWNFTYINVRPELLNLEEAKKTTESSTMTIKWSLSTNFSCKCEPPNMTACLSSRNVSRSPTRMDQCKSVTGRWVQVEDDDGRDIVFAPLYPGMKYKVNCSGFKVDLNDFTRVRQNAWWIETVPVMEEFTTQTDPDKDVDFMDLRVEVFAICADGSVRKSQMPFTLTRKNYNNGLLLQIRDYERPCNMTVIDGDLVRLRANASLTLSSRHAWVDWMAEQLDFSATFDSNSAIDQKKQFRWSVRALFGNWQNYSMEVSLVDIGLTIDGVMDLSPVVSKAGTVNGYDSYLTEQGATACIGFQYKLSMQNPVFQMTLGVKERPFNLETQLSLNSAGTNSSKLCFKTVGQGLSNVLWLGLGNYSFDTRTRWSFKPPGITLAPTQARLCCGNSMSRVTLDLSQVPIVTQVHQLGINISASPFSEPDRFLAFTVAKKGVPDAEQLCMKTEFPLTVNFGVNSSAQDWRKAVITVRFGALDNLCITPWMLDVEQSVMFPMPNASVCSNLTYAKPNFDGIHDGGRGAVVPNASLVTLDLGKWSDVSTAETDDFIYFTRSEGVPKLNDLALKGAARQDYIIKAKVADEWINLCEKTSVTENNEALKCRFIRCMNITNATALPQVKAFLGDIESDIIDGKLAVPMPYITKITPMYIEDTGHNQTVVIEGDWFGDLACDPTGAFTLVGLSGGAEIRIGEYGARCQIVSQTRSRIVCTVTTALTAPWSYDDAYGETPGLIRGRPQSLHMRVGGTLSPWNEQGYERKGLSSEPVASRFLELNLTAQIKKCPSEGMRRENDEQENCIPCELGHFSEPLSPLNPLRCEACAPGFYQDEEGATTCKECPLNTYSREASKSIFDCLCKTGYYSPYLNVSTGAARSGVECLACHGADLTVPPTQDDHCGQWPTAELCDDFSLPTCVNEAPPLVAWRVCTAYCPGGTAWPKSKPGFWLISNAESTAGEFGLRRYRPQLIRCDPPEACIHHNNCERQYEGEACGLCIFGYWQDTKDNVCHPCGQEQAIGVLILFAMVTVMTVGGLLGAGFFMVFKADIQFRHNMQRALMSIFSPARGCGRALNCCAFVNKTRFKKRLVKIDATQAGKSMNWCRHKDLGLVIRVDDNGVAHIAGVLEDSPFLGKIECGWRLSSVESQTKKELVQISGRSEVEVQRILQKAEPPMILTVLVPRRTKLERERHALDRQRRMELAQQIDLSDDRKMFIVMIGVLNSFTNVANFDFEWPPIFKLLVQIVSKLTFDLNFFHPECSVEVDFIQKWVGCLTVPYAMFIPICLAYLGARFVINFKSVAGASLESHHTKARMLRNAFARVCCMNAILMLPTHYQQLLMPFSCMSRGVGVSFVAANPSTRCSTSDPVYVLMVKISICGTLLCGCFYAALMTALWKSWRWQTRPYNRTSIPFYVAMVEVSVFGQRGYSTMVRTRVEHNIAALRTFETDQAEARNRELLVTATEKLGNRCRALKGEEAAKQGLGIGGDETNARSLDQLLQRRLMTLRAKVNLAKSMTKDADRKYGGNFLTYGWILIVNLAIRQLLSVVVINTTKGSLVVIGASFQMMVFAVNAAMLIVFRPYTCDRVVQTEAGMLTMLFLILFSACLKDLLTNHVNAHLYKPVIEALAKTIDGFALSVVVLACCVPLVEIVGLASKLFSWYTHTDQLLNDIYMTQRLKLLAERRKVLHGSIISNVVHNKFVEDHFKALDDDSTVKVLEENFPSLEQVVNYLRILNRGEYSDIELQEKLKTIGLILRKVHLMKEVAMEIDELTSSGGMNPDGGMMGVLALARLWAQGRAYDLDANAAAAAAGDGEAVSKAVEKLEDRRKSKLKNRAMTLTGMVAPARDSVKAEQVMGKAVTDGQTKLFMAKKRASSADSLKLLSDGESEALTAVPTGAGRRSANSSMTGAESSRSHGTRRSMPSMSGADSEASTVSKGNSMKPKSSKARSRGGSMEAAESEGTAARPTSSSVAARGNATTGDDSQASAATIVSKLGAMRPRGSTESLAESGNESGTAGRSRRSPASAKAKSRWESEATVASHPMGSTATTASSADDPDMVSGEKLEAQSKKDSGSPASTTTPKSPQGRGKQRGNEDDGAGSGSFLSKALLRNESRRGSACTTASPPEGNDGRSSVVSDVPPSSGNRRSISDDVGHSASDNSGASRRSAEE